MFGGREQTVDYFSVVNELKNKSTPARSNADYRVVLKRSIEKKPLINETQQNSLKFINDCFKSVVPVKESMPPNLKSIYENYICEFKEANSVEIQVTFMRYLSLYIGGYIPHTLFIRLVYHLLGKPPLSNHLMIGLPTFLAAIQFNSFTPPKSNFSSIDESIAAEVAITVTANSTDSENSHSIYKCFKLLAEGYISPNIAEKWLANYAPKETLTKLSQMTDFKCLHPSKIPREYILCADFCDSISGKQSTKNFDEKEQTARRRTQYELVPFETLENQLQSTASLIDLLANCEVPTVERLQPFFGSYSQEIVSKCPGYNPLAIKRLSEVYNTLYAKYKEFTFQKLNSLKDNYIEYRILYKRTLKKLFDPDHTQIPGVHTIPIGSIEEIKRAQSLISAFIAAIFDQETKESLENNLHNTSLFLNGQLFSATSPLIDYAMALSELIRIMKDADKVEEIPESCKSEFGLRKLYPDDVPKQCIDLILIKIVRQINKATDVNEFSFSTAVSQGMYVSAANFNDGKLVVETQLSPFYKPETK